MSGNTEPEEIVEDDIVESKAPIDKGCFNSTTSELSLEVHGLTDGPIVPVHIKQITVTILKVRIN